MKLKNVELHQAQFLIPVENLIETIKNVFEEVLKTQNFHKTEPPTVNEINDKLLTRKQIAEILNISLPTLDLRVKDGSIPAYQIGKKLMFKEDIVLNNLEKKGGKNAKQK